MEKSNLIKQLSDKKTKDYTYTVAFFLLFSFFVFYVIRPNLITVFEIKTKIKKLQEIDQLYADQITKIIEVQAAFENSREDLKLLQEAISRQPEVNKVLFDVNVSTDESKLIAERIVISDINLKDKGTANKLRSFIINLNLSGNFEDTLAFIRKIYNQRRLKLIPLLELTRQTNQSTQSAELLKIKLEVEGFYL
ncbi:hypothetical protein A2774_01750 [Candidatus Roizmanbacteria bacterium RIFCSPHIGHO2_01_FULL_39_12c]|uniref:Uncharacterized protein n=1 Tax=Candidatus Roizmanbacteria bacterium RIFCSPHIGHO2_01_FULL_39_12c TaxID=1802031 RepID=A0A1F7GBC6_9BACT|nr:MAG: hypothetical protein A2774_01750 [Candidatus Roizmanbacteria bacterium RIFCSPHIGHO2_01_FULL_39_12c]OGK46916.1 MAG: hypothetical protein A2963_05160 [Candidatus Roizmanbacteria bacterium RIFCSPLOWO2_01_FULL_40_13]